MRLCFGSYLAVLVSCKAVNVENKGLCETLLHSVAPNYEFTYNGQENANRVREDVSSKLLRCDLNVPPDVVTPARTAKPEEVAAYFKDHVAPLIDGNRRKDIILALKDIIANDPVVQDGKKKYGIDDDTVVDLVSGATKKALLLQTEFNFDEFLAGVFLFAVVGTTNRSGKDNVKEVSREYVLAFADRNSEITLLEEPQSRQSALDALAKVKDSVAMEIADTITEDVLNKVNQLSVRTKKDDDLFTTLLVEANGCCLNCGKHLGIPKKGKVPVGNCEIVYLKQSPDEQDGYENAVVLCKDDCVPILPIMTWERKSELLEDKRRCAEVQAFLDRISGIRFPNEIETVLRELHKIRNEKGLEPTDPKDLVEIDAKIDEPFLKDKVNASMARLYKTVKSICGRLEQEIGFDTGAFGGLMRAAQLTVESDVRKSGSIDDPQGYITELLVNNLYQQVGQKHKDACEIIVGYLVKRCDLFNENAKQS